MKVPDNPLFRANALYVQDRVGNPIGLYNYLVDSLVFGMSETPEERDYLSYVIAHETSHRQFTHQVGYNTFEIIRRLTSISHALLSRLLAITIGNGGRIKGKSLNELNCEGENPEIKLVTEEIIKRIQFVEKHIDMGSRGIEIVAEFEAIDSGTNVFQEEAEDDIQGTNNDDLQFSKTWLLKTQQIETLIQNYPSDFGGYNVSFGSFQNAVRSAWAGYSVINNHQVRKELLHLCTYILYLNEDNTIQVLDPIKVITENASFCRHNPDKALLNLASFREQLDLQGKKLIDTFEERLLQNIHDNPETELVSTLSKMAIQQMEGKIYLGADTAMQGGHHSQTWSFLSFIWNEKFHNGRVNFIWPYLAENNIPSGLSKDWWKELIFFEALRESLKTQRVLFCPFIGWEKTASLGVRRIGTPEEVKCTDECFIRNMMKVLSRHSELVQQESLCDIES